MIETDADGWRIEHRASGTARELHPDLALLLSTSGSTGAPKLVRLSHRNLVEQRPGDRRVPRPHAGRPRDHLAAAALLLRAVGAPLAPGRRRAAWC